MPKIRLQTLALAACALALVVTTRSDAQDRPGRGQGGGFGRGGFGGGIQIDVPTLLGADQVRKELTVKEEQAKKLDEILTAYREESRGLFGRGGAGGGAQPTDEERAERTKKRAELTAKVTEKLEAALEAEQKKRLGEIVLQQQGVDGLIGAPVVASLKISEEQVVKIKAAIAKRDETLQKLMEEMRAAGGGRGGRGQGGGQPGAGAGGEIREKMEKIRKESDTVALSALTKEQTEALEKLKGKPFELDRTGLFGRGGRGGRGPGAGAGGGEGAPGGGGRRGGGQGGERRRPNADSDTEI
jgi:Spy/CpxP family protein refolding chaperone